MRKILDFINKYRFPVILSTSIVVGVYILLKMGKGSSLFEKLIWNGDPFSNIFWFTICMIGLLYINCSIIGFIGYLTKKTRFWIWFDYWLIWNIFLWIIIITFG
tara:strand:+ start:233 stop:544 length:312 start_codon:yes stop_codon:yes gene_type:complete